MRCVSYSWLLGAQSTVTAVDAAFRSACSGGLFSGPLPYQRIKPAITYLGCLPLPIAIVAIADCRFMILFEKIEE